MIVHDCTNLWVNFLVIDKYLNSSQIYQFVVSRCPENPQSDQVPAGPPQTTAGDGGTHHTPPELLHQAQGCQQARRIHHGINHTSSHLVIVNSLMKLSWIESYL